MIDMRPCCSRLSAVQMQTHRHVISPRSRQPHRRVYTAACPTSALLLLLLLLLLSLTAQCRSRCTCSSGARLLQRPVLDGSLHTSHTACPGVAVKAAATGLCTCYTCISRAILIKLRLRCPRSHLPPASQHMCQAHRWCVFWFTLWHGQKLMVQLLAAAVLPSQPEKQEQAFILSRLQACNRAGVGQISVAASDLGLPCRIWGALLALQLPCKECTCKGQATQAVSAHHPQSSGGSCVHLGKRHRAMGTCCMCGPPLVRSLATGRRCQAMHMAAMLSCGRAGTAWTSQQGGSASMAAQQLVAPQRQLQDICETACRDKLVEQSRHIQGCQAHQTSSTAKHPLPSCRV